MRLGMGTLVALAMFADSNPMVAQATTVFKGRPEIKVVERALNRDAGPVPQEQAPNLECIISRIGDRYYWATRENKEMVAIESGAFITFIAIEGAGYIKVIKPEMKGVASLMGDAEARFDYVEHLTIGLSSVTYFGKRRD